MGGGVNRVEIIDSKGCSRLLVGGSSYNRSLRPFEPMSPAKSSSESVVRSNGAFSSLVICVTGLSKEARKQVMEAAERLGGQYSPNLHPQCTHLVVQSFGGRKLEHALKHGARNGLFVVTLGWFVESVKRNVRLSESLYAVKSAEESNTRGGDELNRLVDLSGSENSCFPVGIHETERFANGRYSMRSKELTLSTNSIYVDSAISEEMRKKVIEAATKEGAKVVDRWFVSSSTSHVVCEASSVQKYLGHTSNLVTPLWVLKTVKEKHAQRLVHMSPDLARQLLLMLENLQNREEFNGAGCLPHVHCLQSLDERREIVNLAKDGVRSRRARRMQACQTSIRPITPSSLLEFICWTVSDPTSTASIYANTFRADDHGGTDLQTTVFFDAKGDDDGNGSDASFANLTRTLTESEKTELILKNNFLTILFPLDRFAEMGPSSQTYFSSNGFTCLQVLDHIYAFYQENMSSNEIEAALHTDSRHADRLRSVYCSKETSEHGYTNFKRVEFLGSRKSFEMLKRVSGDNNSNVYELLIRA